MKIESAEQNIYRCLVRCLSFRFAFVRIYSRLTFGLAFSAFAIPLAADLVHGTLGLNKIGRVDAVAWLLGLHAGGH